MKRKENRGIYIHPAVFILLFLGLSFGAIGGHYYFGLGLFSDRHKLPETGTPERIELETSILEDYEYLAKAGHANAQNELARKYADGYGSTIAKDPEKALYWYEQAANQGHRRAQESLALEYKYGVELGGKIILQKDPGKVVYWLEQAVRPGDEPKDYAHHPRTTHRMLGEIYANGEGIPKNIEKAIFHYEKAAKDGEPESQYNLGILYETGQDIPQDYEKAIYWFEQAGNHGEPKAYIKLAEFYENGLGTPQDIPKAIYYYEQAGPQDNSEARRFSEMEANKGDYNALLTIAQLYEKGQGIPQDIPKAIYYYEKAASAGNYEAQYTLAGWYEKGQGVIPQDYEKALHYYDMAASEDDSNAQFAVGRLYEQGQGGVRQDDDYAKDYYEKAAEQGHVEAKARLEALIEKENAAKLAKENEENVATEPLRIKAEQGDAEAQYALGNHYSIWGWGDNVPTDHKKASSYYEQAAEQGHAGAQFSLGRMHASGYHFPHDYKKAVSYYEQAAKQGHAGAQYFLGSSYEFGDGVEKDYPKAIAYYEQATEQDYMDAQYSLGRMYSQAKGTERDAEKALFWYEKADKQGNDLSSAEIGKLYAEGINGKPDYHTAEMWLEKALDHGGDTLAQMKLGEVYFALGRMHDTGDGVPKDSQKALEYYEKAAKYWNTDAEYQLGLLYANGDRVIQDIEKAKKMLKRAVRGEHTLAQAKLDELNEEWYEAIPRHVKQAVQSVLGPSSESKDAVKKDPPYAVYLFIGLMIFLLLYRRAKRNKASSQHSSEFLPDQRNTRISDNATSFQSLPGQYSEGNQFDSALNFYSGSGAEKDNQETLFYLEPDDEENHFDSGLLSSSKDDIEEEKEELYYLQQAADIMGDPYAQYLLGMMYEHGNGVEKDERKAAFYYDLAAKQGEEEAQARLDIIMKKEREARRRTLK